MCRLCPADMDSTIRCSLTSADSGHWATEIRGHPGPCLSLPGPTCQQRFLFTLLKQAPVRCEIVKLVYCLQRQLFVRIERLIL